MGRSFNRIWSSGRIIAFAFLFAFFMHGISELVIMKLRSDYAKSGQMEWNAMQIVDDGDMYYQYLNLFGSMDVRYKSDKALHYDSKEAELAFYRNSFKSWQMALEDLVTEISSKMTAEEAGKFEASQKIWRESKEKTATEVSSSVKDTREKNMRFMESQIDSTKARAYELLKNYKHILENSFR